MVALPAPRLPRRLRSAYLACVRRGWKPDHFEIYPLALRSALPRIRVPLRETDPDIGLDLQAIVDQAYKKGRYYSTIDYHQSPDPPLQDEDARWARAIVKKAPR